MSKKHEAPEGQTALTPDAGSVGVPATIGQGLGRGHEEPSDMEDLEIPRANLVQYTSSAAQAPKEERIEPGTIINSITKEPLENIFIPIFKFTNFIQWNPRKKDDPNFDSAYEPGEIVFSTNDNRDPRVVDGAKFGPNGEPPKVTKYMNFLCYFVGHRYPLVLSFSKTSFKAGKTLNSLTQFAGGDMFSNKYRLMVKPDERSGTKFFVLEVVPSGKATADEFRVAEKWYEEFRGKAIKVHADEEKKDEGFSE